MIVIDASDCIAGRLATHVAKRALLGEEIKIINSEKAVISGKKQLVFDNYISKRQRGTPAAGPFYPRYPDRILRRIIRGMLPYKKPRGKEAYKRILCYIGVPNELKDTKPVQVQLAKKDKLPTLNYITLKTLSERMGVKIE